MKKLLRLIALLSCIAGISQAMSPEDRDYLNLSLDEIVKETAERSKQIEKEKKDLPKPYRLMMEYLEIDPSATQKLVKFEENAGEAFKKLTLAQLISKSGITIVEELARSKNSRQVKFIFNELLQEKMNYVMNVNGYVKKLMIK